MTQDEKNRAPCSALYATGLSGDAEDKCRLQPAEQLKPVMWVSENLRPAVQEPNYAFPPHPTSRLPSRARKRVSWSAKSMEPPTGNPIAS